ncbi:magnesium transporter NIPA3-like [Festucalex cinctus]
MRMHNASCGREVPAAAVFSQWVGLTLALLSAILIGGSVILKKKALLRLASRGQTRAGDGGHGYLKDCLWWSGLLTMGAGEACNFAAYMYASATLVTPLGALSVFFSAVLSSYLLGEALNVAGKLGCVLCMLGGVLLVIHAPQEQEVTSLEEMSHMMLQPGFAAYMSCVLVACAVLVGVSCWRPGVTRVHLLPDVAVCSLLGAFTVSSVKGLAIAIPSAHRDVTVLSGPLTWLLLATLVISVTVQVHFLNKSLDTFGPLLVYPVYYVLFTSVVLVTSAVLFGEWHKMAATDAVSAVGAFLVMVVGVAMLQLFKDTQVTMPQLTHRTARPERGEELMEEVSAGGGGAKKEDKRRLVDSRAAEGRPPVAERGLFIIS